MRRRKEYMKRRHENETRKGDNKKEDTNKRHEQGIHWTETINGDTNLRR